MGFEPSSISPRLKGHVYCPNTSNFMLEQDCYTDWVAFLLEEGRFAYRAGDCAEEAVAGDVVLCGPGVVFHRRAVTMISFHFLHFDWVDGEENVVNWQPDISDGMIKIANSKRLYSTFSLLRELGEDSDAPAMAMKRNLLRDIWYLYCMDHYKANAYHLFETQDPVLAEAMEFLRLNIFGKISVKQAAQSIGLTQVQFIRRFKKEFGLTPMEYIIKIRLSKAKALLSQTNLTLIKIAALCGYENEFYFSNAFKKKFGITPSGYRDAHRI